jgi:formiminoglutamase
VFYKNAFTDRWWMEVPYPNEKSKHKGKFMVPCSYADYELALKDEIPDRWMKAYHKLM